MHILCLDTTQMDAKFAIIDILTNGIVREEQLDGRTQKAEKLLPLIERAISTPDIKLEKIIAVTGPGVFTGIRVGLSIAKGLGVGLRIPVMGISAFELMKLQSIEDSSSNLSNQVNAILPARGDGFYYQSWGGVSNLPKFISSADFEHNLEDKSEDYWLVNHSDFKNHLVEKGVAPQGITIIEQSDLVVAARFAGTADAKDAPCDALYIREADAAIGKPLLTFAK